VAAPSRNSRNSCPDTCELEPAAACQSARGRAAGKRRLGKSWRRSGQPTSMTRRPSTRWLPSCFPTLVDVAPLEGDALFRVLKDEQRRQLLHVESAQTVIERGDGLIPAVQVKTGGQRLPSLQQLADTFDECIGPAKLEASTRGLGGYQAAWRTVLT
jgi:hypothetical protein